MTKINELNEYFATISAFELSIDQARADKLERLNANDYTETAGFEIMDLPAEYLTEDQKYTKIEIQTTKQNSKAIPVFYVEDMKDVSTIKSYLAQGWKDARAIGVERFLLPEERLLTGFSLQKAIEAASYKQLSKVCFHANRYTNVVIFNLSTFHPKSLGQIFNAIVNNKMVLVRAGKATFKNLQLDTPEYIELSQMFSQAKKQRITEWQAAKVKRNTEFKLSEILNHELTDKRLAIANILAQLWELESPTSTYEFNLLMETISTYFKLEIPATRPIHISLKSDYDSDDAYEMNQQSGDLTLDQIISLPIEVQERIIPLVTIEVGSFESYGNEQLLDMVA